MHSEGSDLIFGIETDNTRFETSVKNWDSSPSHKIEGVIFNSFFSVSLSSFDTEHAESIEKRLRRNLLQAQVHDKFKQYLSALQLAQVKALLFNELLTTSKPISVNNRKAIEKAFEFWDKEDLANFRLLSRIQPVEKSILLDAPIAQTIRALYWLAVSTC